MGNTYKSLPDSYKFKNKLGQKVLPDRINIVLGRYDIPHVAVARKAPRPGVTMH